jgi:hypothetical protein
MIQISNLEFPPNFLKTPKTLFFPTLTSKTIIFDFQIIFKTFSQIKIGSVADMFYHIIFIQNLFFFILFFYLTECMVMVHTPFLALLFTK